MDRHAYINIEPNNGGIVLNVSDEGLCFHSFDPVRKNGPVRFWFSQQNRRIEAEAELAWTDSTQKGGLRFKALPAEAHEQIRNWMSQPGAPVGVGQVSASSAPLRSFPVHSVSPPEAKTVLTPADASPAAAVAQEARAAKPLRGFSGGFAAGLAVSMLLTGGFLFHIYRSQVGELLIRLGEQFAARPQAQTQTVSLMAETAAPAPQAILPPPATASQVPQTVSPSLQVVVPARPTTSPVLAPPIQPGKPLPQPLTKPQDSQPAKVETPVLSTPVPTTAGNRAPEAPAIADAQAISSARPTISLPTTAVAPTVNLVADKTATDSKSGPPSAPGVSADNSRVEGARADNTDATSEMYFEVGGFKNKQQAHNATEKLTQLGFPATAIHKNHLWADAYHVLVGPYGDDDQAEATHQNLVSQGFKPRPFERGSRNLILRSGVTLNGTHMPVGECTINWESYVSDAVVKFVHDNDVVATTSGKWVKREVKYTDDAYVYRKNGDGSRTLLEVRFAGMRQALVFGKSS
jgi:SPOR domain/PilZ domain